MQYYYIIPFLRVLVLFDSTHSLKAKTSSDWLLTTHNIKLRTCNSHKFSAHTYYAVCIPDKLLKIHVYHNTKH